MTRWKGVNVVTFPISSPFANIDQQKIALGKINVRYIAVKYEKKNRCIFIYELFESLSFLFSYSTHTITPFQRCVLSPCSYFLSSSVMALRRSKRGSCKRYTLVSFLQIPKNIKIGLFYSRLLSHPSHDMSRLLCTCLGCSNVCEQSAMLHERQPMCLRRKMLSTRLWMWQSLHQGSRKARLVNEALEYNRLFAMIWMIYFMIRDMGQNIMTCFIEVMHWR